MTDYLRLAQERAPQAQEEQDNPYLPLAREVQSLQQNRARTVIESALKDDPDLAAERLRVSQSSGVPLRVVERNLDELRVKERARAIDLARMAEDSPVLYRQLVDPTFATTSIDDLDTLKNIEQAVGKGVAYVMGADGQGGLPRDVVGAAKTVGLGATVGIGKMIFDVAGTLNDLIGWQSGAQGARAQSQAAQEAMNEYGFQGGSSTRDAIRSGLQSAGTNLALLPIGLVRGLYGTATQAATTVAGLMSAGVGADAYLRAREQGRSQVQSLQFAIPEAVFEFVFERIPASKLFGDIANNTGLLKTLGTQVVSEGWTEQVTTLAQDFNEWMNLNQDKTLAEFIQERPEAAYQTFIATLVGVGVQTSTIQGINKVIEQASSQSLVFEQDLLQRQLQLAAASMLRQRSPEQFRAHMQRVVDANEGAKKEIYVDAEVLNQLPQELLAQLPESVRESLPGALETNSTVAIPMADVLTVAPGTDLEQILNDNARMRPNAPSRIEAELTAQLLAQDAERVLQQAADTSAWQQSTQAVQQTILDQLNATGRFTPDVNEAYATLQANFFSTMAARVGLTPQELYDRYTLKAAARPVGQGPVLNAGVSLADVTAQWDAAGITGDVYENNGVVTLSRIVVPEGQREQGTGTAAMQALVEYADRTGQRVALSPSADFGGNKKRLMEFYKRFGFVENKGRNKDFTISESMIREPQQGYNQAARVTTGPVLFDDIVQSLGLTPQEINSTAIEYMTGLPGDMAFLPPYQGGLTDVVAFLHERRLESGLPVLDITKPEDRAQLARLVAAEALAAIRNAGDSLEWYDTTVAKTLAMMAVKHPELESDLNARNAFLVATAIASQGLNVEDNLAFASEQYQAFRATGQFPLEGKGESSGAMAANFQKANDLLAELGPDMFREFLVTPFTVRELEYAGFPVGGETKDTVVLGSSIFGPKIGFGFYSNLNGNFEPVTMDMWFMRTIGRLAGTLPAFERAKFDKQVQRLRDAIKERGRKDRGIFASQFDRELVAQARTDEGMAIELARQVKRAHERDFRANRAAFDAGTRVKTDLVAAAETMLISLEKPKDVPASGGERNLLRDVVTQVVDLVAQQYGQRVPPAALQALIWYPEQELYKAMGVKLRVTSQDYAGAARKLLESEGFNGQQLDDAAERGAAGARPADGAADTAAVPGDDQGAGRARPFQADERTRFLVERNRQLIAEQRADQPANVVFEVAPDPNDAALTDAWRALDNATRLAISQRVAARVLPDVLRTLAANGELTAQIGSYLADTNPSFALRVSQGNPVELARALGFILAQDSMVALSDQPFEGGQQTGAIVVEVGDKTSAEIDQIYQALRAIEINGEQPIGGQSTVGGQMVVLNFSNVPTDQLAAAIDQALAGSYNVKTRDVYAAFPEKQEYDYAREQNVRRGGDAPLRQWARNARAEAQRILRDELDRTTAGTGDLFQSAAREQLADAGGLTPPALQQGPRGTFNPQEMLITLGESADLSTFLHESGHFFLEVLADLASQPDAPAAIQADMATTLKWFGVPDLATWNGYTLDQKRPYHERWAESFEAYLFEGKAPNQELQPLFRRFRSWMVNVYKSLTAFMQGRNLQISEEVRRVFDRLVATDEQIREAEQAAGLLPEFDATNEAIEQLQARSLRDLKWTVNARNKVIKALQKEAATLRKGIEAEVRAEVEAQPLYAAMKWLKKGEMVDPATGDQVKAEKGFRLNTEALAEMYPETMLGRPDLTRLKGMTVKGGLHPDIVADMFGFESGDSLVRNLIDAEPLASVVEGMTDQRMLERHGDLVNPEAIEAAANEAVHNEARARSLATELKSQTEMMSQRQDTGRVASNGRPITVNAIAEAAKQFAANLAARRRIKDLKNAAWQHRAAEARAGKAWQQATAKGDTQAAVQAKRDQVLNNATVKALQEAQAEAKKIIEFFRRVTKDNNEKTVEKGRDPDVVNAMRAILAAYGVAPRLQKSALEYMDTVAKNDPAMYAALKPSVDGALFNAKPLPEMTMEELRGLNDELRAMWVLAKRSRQMEVDGNLLDIEEAADELLARMETIGIPLEIPGERGSITEAEERGIKLKFAKAILSRVEQWAERLDGKFGGPFLRLVFQPVKEAADRYRADRVEYRKQYTALLQAVAPALPAGPVAAPELGYTFGNARDSGMAEILHAILHTGNESNKRKLLLGRGWASENADGTLDTSRWDAFVDRMVNEGKITKAHYDFAQGVWDLLEQMKPLAQETHRKVFGRYFAEVTADAFVTPFGTYRGGYVPAQTDARIVNDAKLRELAEGENESMAYAFPSAPSGFTKARVEYNKPLLLDLRALSQHMDKVLLFSHMQGAVTDVRRLLSNKRVSYALDRVDPGAYEGMLMPWLNRSAKQIVETPVTGDRRLSRWLSSMRSRAGMSLMFANLSNTFQQITGFSTAAIKVRPNLMLKATGEFTRNPKAMKERVAELSTFMKDRMLNEVAAMNDAVEQILVDPTLLERSQAWTQKHAYFLQAAADNTMSPIIWTAAFNQASEEGMSQRDAIRFADGVIRQTQGTTLPEDVSRFETGPAYGRLFTQFVGYFNMMANTNATAMKQIVDEMGLRKGAGKLLYVGLVGLMIPIWVAEAIAQAMRGGPDDEDDDGYLDDWLAAVFGFGTLRGLVAMIPGVAQLGQLVINRFNDNPADDKFSLSPAVSMIETSVSAPFSVYKAIVDEGSAQKAIRDTAAAATMITGLPIYGVARPIGYLAGVAQEKIEPTGPVDLVRGVVTGTASQESRVP